MRPQVLSAVNISIMVLSNVTLCCITDRYQHFEGTCCLYLKERKVKIVDLIFQTRTTPAMQKTCRQHALHLQDT